MLRLRCNARSAHLIRADRGVATTHHPAFPFLQDFFLFSFFFSSTVLQLSEVFLVPANSFFIGAHSQSFIADANMSLDTIPAGTILSADKRGAIVGSSIATITLTFLFVFLRLLSRKLSRAGYWVRLSLFMLLAETSVESNTKKGQSVG